MTSDSSLYPIAVKDPLLCACCPFGDGRLITLPDGSRRRMLVCSRLDCDNWQRFGDGESLREACQSGSDTADTGHAGYPILLTARLL